MVCGQKNSQFSSVAVGGDWDGNGGASSEASPDLKSRLQLFQAKNGSQITNLQGPTRPHAMSC
jgi:hypothetical protein